MQYLWCTCTYVSKYEVLYCPLWQVHVKNVLWDESKITFRVTEATNIANSSCELQEVVKYAIQ